MSSTSKKRTRKQTSPTTNPLSLKNFAQITYNELRHITNSYFQNKRSNHTLQPTTLIHKVFIQLSLKNPETYVNRTQFFSKTTRTMRQTLMEYARTRNADKRGNRCPKIPL